MSRAARRPTTRAAAVRARAARRRWAAALFAAPACLGFAADGFAGDGRAGGVLGDDIRTAVTRSAAFAIPAGDLGDRADLAAVRLFRSTDGGISWRAAGTFPPAALRLPHEAPRDGEYVFSVRGLDRRGGLRPPTAPAPQFRVTVDTAGPALSLKGWWSDENRVRLVVRCEDPHLVRDGVRLQWLSADPAAAWADLTPGPEEATSWEGLVRMDLTRDLETPFDVTVRALARDDAGNAATAVLPLPRPATAESAAAGDGVPLLSFVAPAPGGGADSPAGGVTFAGAAAPPARLPGSAFPVTQFPVAQFPVAAFPRSERGPEPAAGAFPVARFRLPPGPPERTFAPPAADAAPGTAPDENWGELNTGWDPAPVPPPRPAPAADPVPVAGPEVLFDVGSVGRRGGVVPASAAVPPRPAPARPVPAGEAGVDDLYASLLAATPGDRRLRLAYADRLIEAGRFDDAARQLRALLRADAADAEALRRLTHCLAPAGDSSKPE